MAQRLRFYDLRLSSLPQDIGLCADDIPRLAKIVNSSQARLIYAKEAGDDGWHGTFAEIRFTVSRALPYITLPREVARLESINACNTPIQLNNQFREYMRFGNGRLPRCPSLCGPGLQAYARNNAPTFVDMSNPPQIIAAYPTSDQDVGKRVFIQGLDSANNTIYSDDTFARVQGVFVDLVMPFAATTFPLNRLSGIQKDVTVGQVQFYQIDPTTGDQVLLLTMEPTETTAWYRRYYLNALPQNCCGDPLDETNVQVTAIAKLELIPVVVDTDYTLLTGEAGKEAIIEEAQSWRYSKMDTPAAKQMAQEKHMQAIRLLNGQLTHEYGRLPTDVDYSVFGSARLRRQRIGSLV